MLKKLMSGIVIGSMVLSMVGCSSNEQPKEQVYIIKHVDSQGNETKEQVTKQEYDKQVKEAKEAGKKVTTETKDTTKEEVKKDTTKKEQNDNIDPETGLAKVKDGTHLEEVFKIKKVDLAIIGAGPVGTFAAHFAHLHGLNTILFDSLSELGGQPQMLYPFKQITDIPAFGTIKAHDLIQRLTANLENETEIVTNHKVENIVKNDMP